ncbi:Structural maintenance of chromosomes protein 6, partial [Phlyctochytrium planicorne]
MLTAYTNPPHMERRGKGRDQYLENTMDATQDSMEISTLDAEMVNDENYIPTSQEYTAALRRKSQIQTREEMNDAEEGSPVPTPPTRKRQRQIENDDTLAVDSQSSQRNHADQHADSDPEYEPEDSNEVNAVRSQKRAKKGGPVAEFDAKKVKAMREDCGTIEHIELVNFMCHSFLRVDFNSNINFVIGHNGSTESNSRSSNRLTLYEGGKSAILTALTVCLGGKATFTNRASSVKNLLKEGEKVGSVTVRIRNMGPDTYRPEFYGSKIIIERKITKEGHGCYKIKSEKGTTISTTKEEIIAICDHLSIAIDNPMAILTQDTSRMFLANSSPKDKYNFFLKGTLLAQLSADHAQLNEYISRASATLNIKEQGLPDMKKVVDELKAKWKEIEKWQDIENSIETEKSKLAWALVKTKEDELHLIQQEMQSVEGKLEKTLPLIQDCEQNIANCKSEKIEITDRMASLKENGAPLVARMTSLKRDRKEQNDKIREIRVEENRILRDYRKAENERNEMQQKIDAESKKLQDSVRDIREEKQSQIESLKGEQAAHERQNENLLSQIDLLESQRTEAASRRNDLRRLIEQARDDVDSRRRILTDMQRGQSDQFAAFPNGTANVVRAIDQMAARNGWKGIKPIGPIGLYCKLRKKEYSRVIESVVGGNLNAFIVTDSGDLDRMKRIFKDCKCERLPILWYRGPMFDYRNGEPDQRYNTILRCLQIENPYVLRTLIVNNEIEKTIIVDTRDEGDNIAEEGNFKQRNISTVYTKDNIRLGGRGGGLQTTALVYEHKGRPRIEVDLKDYIEQAENDLREAIRRQQHIDGQRSDIESQESHIQAQISELKVASQHRTVSTKLARIKQIVERLEDELKEQQPNNINILETYRAEAEEKMAVLNNQLVSIRQQISDMEAVSKQADEELEAIEQETRVVQQEHEQLKSDMLKNEQKMFTDKKSLEHYIGKRDEYRIALQERERQYASKKEEVDGQVEMALQMTDGQRIEVRDNPQKLLRSINDMEAKLKEKRKQTGSREEVFRMLTEKKEEYKNAKVELFFTKNAVTNLKQSLTQRAVAWEEMRRFISIRAKNCFSILMEKRGYYAKITLDHPRQALELRVDVNRKKNAGGEWVEIDTEEIASSEKDPRTLSGGEKSYSTVCLLLSLWESMANPFRALDEFDVFMDAVNRRISMKLMIDNARNDQVSRQYIFITPQDMSHVPGLGSNDVKIIKLRDPERNQRTLNFSGAGPS